MAKTILVADDDELMLNFVRYALKEEKYRIIEALDGKKALEYLDKYKSHKIDLIITDYNMPHINGLELASLVKNSEKYNNIPMVLMTSDQNLSVNDINKVFSEVIYKPFKPALFSKSISKLLV